MEEEKVRDIDTLRERTLKLALTDEEAERICRFAGENGLTVSQLIENFIADLTGSGRTNGSDERSLARLWVGRCIFWEKSGFLKDMMNTWDVEHILKLWEDIQEAEKKLKTCTDEESTAYIMEDLIPMREELREYYDDYLKFHESSPETLEEGMQRLAQWKENSDRLKGYLTRVKMYDGSRILEQLKTEEGNPYGCVGFTENDKENLVIVLKEHKLGWRDKNGCRDITRMRELLKADGEVRINIRL